MYMDTRSSQVVPVEGVSVDLKQVENAFKRICRTVPKHEREAASLIGVPVTKDSFEEFLTITAEEKAKAEEKGLSGYQWKLREIFRRIFEQEFVIYRDEQSFRGRFVSISGLTLQQRMEKYPDVAEKAFLTWTNYLGLGKEYEEGKQLHHCVVTVYERFSELLYSLM